MPVTPLHSLAVGSIVADQPVVRIRDLHPSDVDQAVDLLVAASARGDGAGTRATLTRPGPLFTAVQVAERDCRVVGVALAAEQPGYRNATSVTVAVTADERRRGIGQALAERVLTAAAERRPASVLTAEARDDGPAGRAFAEELGFAVTGHSGGWRLGVAGRLPQLEAQALTAAARAGVQVRVADPVEDAGRVVQTMTTALSGLPVAVPIDPDHVVAFLPAGAVMLLAERRAPAGTVPVGVAVLRPQSGPGGWYTVFTGVVPAQRGHGVAGALKAASLLTAARCGAPAVVTHNDDRNEGIRRVNEQAGALRTVGYWALLRRPKA